jgi:hypothetical protein
MRCAATAGVLCIRVQAETEKNVIVRRLLSCSTPRVLSGRHHPLSILADVIRTFESVVGLHVGFGLVH